MQQGRFVARQIERRLQGLSAREFIYSNKGNLATIGRKAAVAEFTRARITGFPAWLLWLGVHICFLVGFRNRYIVLVQWIWHYFTYQRGARLITGMSDETFSWPSQPRRLAKVTTALVHPVPKHLVPKHLVPEMKLTPPVV